jgi:hypothetical protein
MDREREEKVGARNAGHVTYQWLGMRRASSADIAAASPL